MTGDTYLAEWLYLFSSITTDLYAVDALNALALPSGWIQHFRYEERHLDPNLCDSLPEIPSEGATANEFKGRPVVICYVNQERRHEPEVGYEVLGLFPLRLGKAVRAYKDGGVAHFWFSVQDYLPDESTDETGVAAHNTALREALGDKTPHAGMYAALGSAYRIKGARDEAASRAFQAAVRAISGQGLRRDATIYARFHGLKELKSGRPVEERPALPVRRGILPNESGYAVREGQIYGIDISTYHRYLLNRRYLRNATIEMDFDPDHFIGVGRRRSAVGGRYDRFVFPIAVRGHRREHWTSLTVRASAGVGSTGLDEEGRTLLDQFRGAEWVVPVHIKVDRRQKLLLVLPQGLTEAIALVGSGATAALVATEQAAGWIALAIVVGAAGVVGRTLLQVVSPDRG